MDPIVVLTYAYAGADLLGSLLAANPELALTSGTGVLPLCEQAAITWRRAEGRDGPPSALALTSMRALTGSVITLLLAREGKPRWCEIATAQPGYAESFLRAYPGTRFLCLHRNCVDVIRLALRANPWGLADPEFGPFADAFPGYSAAALAAYWVAHTKPMLEFEAAHPGACRRVRYEDLNPLPGSLPADLAAFLGLHQQPTATPDRGDQHPGQGPGTAEVPFGQLPLPLMSEVEDLLATLSYPPAS